MGWRFRVGLLAFAGLGLLTLSCGIAHGQEPIRVKVNLVNVAFVARDARGALLDNLTLDDVDVVEDAIPQKIAFFSRSSDVPLTLGLVVDASGSQDHFPSSTKTIWRFSSKTFSVRKTASSW
jgi:hypothetical protein